jgi:hypothetical protein
MTESDRTTTRRTKRMLALLAALAVLPVLLSYLVYYAWPRDARANYGALLPTRPALEIRGTTLDGSRFTTAGLRGRWTMLVVAPGACDARCEAALYATRQARTIQNAERERVARVWLIPDDRVPSRVLAGDSDLLTARIAPAATGDLPQGNDRIYLLDPLGNYVLAWPANPDIKAMARDLTRLLRASRIG